MIQTSKKALTFLGLLLLFYSILSASSMAADNKTNAFPGRTLYPDVEFIELEAFHTRLMQHALIVIDVRSKYEYDTLRIEQAVNIPLASHHFLGEVSKIRAGNSNPIVVYCNGKTCMKSYKAVEKLTSHGIKDVVAYDAGILDFARNYPKNTILLGKVLNHPERLISNDDFKKHALPPALFGKKIANSNAILLDIRERIQREDGISMFVGREHRVTLDNTRRLNRYIEAAKEQNKTLLVYDAAGKQVRWLQYYFKEKNLDNYFFMDGGISAYYKDMEAH